MKAEINMEVTLYDENNNIVAKDKRQMFEETRVEYTRMGMLDYLEFKWVFNTTRYRGK